MGVPDFLNLVLGAAGRSITWEDLQQGCYVTRDTNSEGNNSSGKKRKRRRRRERRPLRVGIDVSSWIYRAAHGFGDMLADERHLTNYGRAQILLELKGIQNGQLQPSEVPEEKLEAYIKACVDSILGRLLVFREKSQTDLLVVLDGKSPPLKKQEVNRRREIQKEHIQQRDEPLDPDMTTTDAAESPTRKIMEHNEKRTKANRRSGAGQFYRLITNELLVALSEMKQFSYLVSPYEADSQLAFLSEHGYIDLIVTEDSDLVAHGAKSILYKLSLTSGKFGRISHQNSEKYAGRLFQFVDIASASHPIFENKKGNLNLLDFSPVMMAVLFVCAGCDYCEKLKGIGLIRATRIIRTAFLVPPSKNTVAALMSPLDRVFDGLYRHSFPHASTRDAEFQDNFEKNFMMALIMYRHPIVFDPVRRKCIMVRTTKDENNNLKILCDPILKQHKPYARLCNDIEFLKENVLGEIPEADTFLEVAEGRDRIREHMKNKPNSHTQKQHTNEGKAPVPNNSEDMKNENRHHDEMKESPQKRQHHSSSGAGVAGLTQESTEALDGSVQGDDNISIRSPNLLLSTSTPETATQTSTSLSQKTHSSSKATLGSMSPNLLQSSASPEP